MPYPDHVVLSDVFVRIQRDEGGPIDNATLEAYDALYKGKGIHLVNDAGEDVGEDAAIAEAIARAYPEHGGDATPPPAPVPPVADPPKPPAAAPKPDGGN